MISAQDYRLPSGVHILNVKTGYGAVGDGVADDTASIKAAILDGCKNQYYLFFPKGTYLVSDQLQGIKPTTGYPDDNLKVFGENRAETIIKLKDNTTGFGDKAVPKALLRFNSDRGSTILAGWETSGEGNEAFGNYLEHITVDSGNNVGAVGVDYLGNNHGAIRDVVVKGNGFVGIDLFRKWPGPCLIKNVRIEGFDWWARVGWYEYSVTCEHIEMANQQVGGFYLEKNQLTIRDLKNTNTNKSVPVIVQNNQYSQATLIDADLGGVKIDNQLGDLLLRNITNMSSLNHQGTTIPGPTISEWASRTNLKQFAEASPYTLNLPVSEPPEYHSNDMSTWASVLDYGAAGSGGSVDASSGIQAAMDSGKSTIYFPTNSYFSAQTIRVPASVKRIAGFGSSLYPKALSGFTDGLSPKVLMRTENTGPLVVERLRIAKFSEAVPGLVSLEQAGSGPLFLKDANLTSHDRVNPSIRTTATAGSLFIENTVATLAQFNTRAQKVWARALNIETSTLKLDLHGTHIWLLGFKTENVGPVAMLTDQGRMELLGGFFYPSGSPSQGTRAFTSSYSTMSLNYIEDAYSDAASYPIHVEETSYASGITSVRTLPKASVATRGWGHKVNLYTSVDNGDAPPPSLYAFVYAEPVEVSAVAQNLIITYRVLFRSQDFRDLSTLTVTFLPGETLPTKLSKIQSAVNTEAARLGMTIVPANMTLPSINVGT